MIDSERVCIDCKKIKKIKHFTYWDPNWKRWVCFSLRCNPCRYKRVYKQQVEKHGMDWLRKLWLENKHKKLAKWLCYRCQKERNPYNSHRCNDHLISEKIRFAKSSIKVQDYYDMLTKQDGKCVYTGVDIEIGRNDSLEHIIPKSKWWTWNLDNLCICSLDFNRMKKDHSLEYIKEICEKFIKRYYETDGFKSIR